MSATIKIVPITALASRTATDLSVTDPTTGTGWKAVGLETFVDPKYGPCAMVVYDNTPSSKQIANESITPTANSTVTKRFFFTSAVTLKKLAIWALTKPASVGGTVLFTAKKNGSTTVLSAANVDMELLVDNTYTAQTLTLTSADLAFAAGDYLELKAVSNNADMTGAADARCAFEFDLT